jgi:hypothetical protein
MGEFDAFWSGYLAGSPEAFDGPFLASETWSHLVNRESATHAMIADRSIEICIIRRHRLTTNEEFLDVDRSSGKQA